MLGRYYFLVMANICVLPGSSAARNLLWGGTTSIWGGGTRSMFRGVIQYSFEPLHGILRSPGGGHVPLVPPPRCATVSVEQELIRGHFFVD